MKRLLKIIFIFVFILGLLAGMLAVSTIEEKALVAPAVELTAFELKQVKRFIRSNNPTQLKTGQFGKSRLDEQDINLLLNYISQNIHGVFYQRISSKISLSPQLATVQASLRLPYLKADRYINITADLITEDINNQQIVKLKSLNIGKFRMPDSFRSKLTAYIHSELQTKLPEYNVIVESVQSIAFENQVIQISYIWDQKTTDTIKTQISSRVLSKELKQALIAHANYLASISYQLPAKPTLHDLIQPMFEYAMQRSRLYDPVIENKAVFIALGAYALKRNIPELIGEKPEAIAKITRIYLKGRHDLSKHLMLSAAITSMADSELAESIGFVKEVYDSKRGSGFSFADLAADQAGIKLAKTAIESEQLARKIQFILANATTDADYMPDIENLPEGIEQYKFEQDYTNTESDAYKKITRLIKQRIDELPVYL